MASSYGRKARRCCDPALTPAGRCFGSAVSAGLDLSRSDAKPRIPLLPIQAHGRSALTQHSTTSPRCVDARLLDPSLLYASGGLARTSLGWTRSRNPAPSRGIFADNAQRAPRAQPQPKFLHQKHEGDAAVSFKGKWSGAEAIEK